jgi:hypothetical protein
MDIKPMAQNPRGESIRVMVANTVYSDFMTGKVYHFSRIMQGFFSIFNSFFLCHAAIFLLTNSTASP